MYRSDVSQLFQDDIAIQPCHVLSLSLPKSLVQGGPQHLFSQDEIAEIASYAWMHLSDQVQALVVAADKICGGVFPLVSQVEFNFANGIPWRGPFSDPEYLFYLNRWYHGVTLAKAFAYTGSEHYAARFVDLLEKWAADNPPDSGSPVWESYSVGERIVNWLFAHYLLQGSELYCNRGAPLLLALLSEHAEYLSSHLEDRVIHNHLINNARALFTYGLLCPSLPKADELREKGWDILMREINWQFRGDGMLGEQSTHYHLLLLSRYTEAALLAERNGYCMPEGLADRLRQMFFVGNLFVRPDRSLALIGDVSPDIEPANSIGILAVGSALFGVPSCVAPNEYALWYLGRKGLAVCSPRPLDSGLYRLPESGYTVYRTPRMHFIMRCDPRGEVIRHGHHDVLGLDLWANGFPILIDPGNSSFNSDQWEKYFRCPRAHSTIVIDGMTPYIQSPILRCLLPAKYVKAKADFTRCEQIDGRIVIEAYHSGYGRLPQPVTVRRQVQILGEDSVLITDRLDGAGRHLVEIILQFGQNRVEVGADPLTLLVYEPAGERVAKVEFKSEARLALNLRKGWLSSAYGLRTEATVVICSFELNGSAQVETLFALEGGKGLVNVRYSGNLC